MAQIPVQPIVIKLSASLFPQETKTAGTGAKSAPPFQCCLAIKITYIIKNNIFFKDRRLEKYTLELREYGQAAKPRARIRRERTKLTKAERKVTFRSKAKRFPMLFSHKNYLFAFNTFFDFLFSFLHKIWRIGFCCPKIYAATACNEDKETAEKPCKTNPVRTVDFGRFF